MPSELHVQCYFLSNSVADSGSVTFLKSVVSVKLFLY